jgi:hydrogenase-4 component B
MLMAHVGAIAILLCFGVLQAGTGDYTFANMRAQHADAVLGLVGFLLAVFGFGAKAGCCRCTCGCPRRTRPRRRRSRR